MPYLEIYPIENTAEKLSKQLDAVLEAKPTMYSKTKDRYKKIAYSLLQSVEKISSIIEEESLICSVEDSDGHRTSSYEYSNEFNELSYSDENHDDCSDLAEAVEHVRDQITACNDFSSSKIVPSAKNDKNSRNNKNKNKNKETFSKFASVIQKGVEVDFGYVEVNQCAKLIHDWFHTRFIYQNDSINTMKSDTFKYNMKQIPAWISYIIIMFGYYQSIGISQYIIDTFDSWCTDLRDVNTPSHNWAVPCCIHECMKSEESKYFTMNAVVICDILMNSHYYQLTESTSDNGDVFLSASPVADIVKLHNPDLTPKIRTRFANQNILISECNLTENKK